MMARLSSELPTAATAAPSLSMDASMEANSYECSSSAASHMSVFLGSPPDSPPHRPTPALKLPQQPGCGRPVKGSSSRSSSDGSSGSGSSGSGATQGGGRHCAGASAVGSSAPAKPKPTGYRKLWALVSSVERGQRLDHQPKREDVTVENLIKAVSQLGPAGSVLDAIAPGLAFLDSRATVALLKGLAKAGMPLRAVEIFDHLRSVPASDELSALCDIYTYTTMISQCNSHHQLRRALELVAEMRGRDVPLNVHTYSALLNVCLKANELELAQDVHARMLAEGVAPNLVTYNTLLDIYHKAGLWGNALGVLDLLQHQNIRPEARTHNTIIAACNAAGRFTEAVRVFETMVASGVEPNGASYNAALTSYARSGGDQLDTALALFAAMGARGYERGANTYAAVLAATEQPGRWDIALKLLQQMQGEGVRPSSACLTSAMTACLHGGEPLRAEQLFNRLCGVCKPDAATFSTLIIVFTSLGKVQEAINMLEIMLRSGQHIEPATLTAVIDAAWGTGVVLLQQYAQQLHERGRQQGLFPLTVTQQVCSEGCVLALQLPGGPAHVVQLSLLGLLAQLREQAGTLLSPLIEGSGCAKVLLRLPVQGQDASALRHLTTTQLSSLASPFVSIPPVLPSAATSAVGGASSPTAPDNASAATPELHFVAEAAAVGEWLQSPAVLLALGQLVVPASGCPAMAGFCAAGGRGGVDGLVVSADDATREAKCRQAMASVAALDSLATSAHAIPPAMLPQRCELAAMLLQHTALLGLPSEIGHDAVQLLDRLLASPSLAALAASVSPPLLAAACLMIAARHDPAAAAADTASLCGAQPQQVALVAAQVQQLLGSRGCIAISVMRVLQLMLERLGVTDSRADGAAAMAVCGQAAALLTRAAVSLAFVGCVPSVMASAVLYASRLAAGLLPAWPSALAGLTGFSETDAALQPAIQAAMQLLVEL